MNGERNIRVKAMTRVEGEGALRIRLRDGKVDQVQLNIFEPPRLFEALLRGRKLGDVPDITARICGICPVAYQMSSVHALERALGVEVSPQLHQLRRLLYCGEWIESHSLHVHLLHAPDFLGYDSALSMARKYPDEVNRGLRLKKHGNQLLEALGGRAVHPINVAVGGFYRLPRREELATLVPDFQWGLEAAEEATRWAAGFDFPDFERPYSFVALSHPNEYAMCEGEIRTSDGLSIDVADFEHYFQEQQVSHSTALQAVRVDTGGTYFLGPLARINLNREQLLPRARRIAHDVGLEQPCLNPYKSIVARCIEVVQAYEEALSLLRGYQLTGPARIPYAYRKATGAAATEAPRGLLYHRYDVDADGHVTSANIVPPTSQNQSQIEDDLREYLPEVISQTDEQVGAACERLVRSYDPCISCATHFLRVTLERGP